MKFIKTLIKYVHNNKIKLFNVNYIYNYITRESLPYHDCFRTTSQNEVVLNKFADVSLQAVIKNNISTKWTMLT